MDDPKGFANVLDRCLAVRSAEQVLLLTDEGTDPEVVAGLVSGIEARSGVAVVSRIPTPLLPGSEPPSTVAAAMREAGAIIELTSLFIGSSAARRVATQAGARYLAMPGVRLETFRDDGPLAVDFDAIRADADQIGSAWEQASTFRLTTPAGTDLRGSVEGRPGRVLHGLAREDGDYMAPPDIEAGTAPVERSGEGTVVIDADLLFMGQGPLPSPVVLRFAERRARRDRRRGERPAPRDARALRRRPDGQPGRGLDGVQSVGAMCAVCRWRPNPREGRRTSRWGTPSRTEAPSMRWRISTA